MDAVENEHAADVISDNSEYLDASAELLDAGGDQSGLEEPSERAMNSTFNAGEANSKNLPVIGTPVQDNYDGGSQTISRPGRPRPAIDASENSISVQPAQPVAAATPATARPRQKTMVVESSTVAELRKLFAAAKDKIGEEKACESVAELERSVLHMLNATEKENNKRVYEVRTQNIQTARRHDSDLEWYRSLAAETLELLENLAAEREKNGTPTGGGPCDGNCSAVQHVRSDRDVMVQENQRLFEAYSKIRNVSDTQREEYAAVHERLKQTTEELKITQAKYYRLKQNAQEQLARASSDIEHVEKQSEEKTVGLRLKVRTMDSQLASLKQELEIKTKSITELNDICQMLMKQVEPTSDGESVDERS